MNHLSLKDAIQVMETLDQIGFKETQEQITNTEADEIFMVWINKQSKTYKYIDHNFLMNQRNDTIQLTQLKDIKQWEQ